MLLPLHPDNPHERNLKQIVACLENDGVIIYPTDTIYGIGCSLTSTKGFERICRLKGIAPKNAQFSFVCCDLSHLSDYATGIDTPVFRLLKQYLPGPFTFILNASKQVPKIVKSKKQTVGIRIPESKITHELVKMLGHPIMSVSLPMEEDVEYYTDPELIHDLFGDQVDIVIDGGIGGIIPYTIVYCTSGHAELIREGAGEWES